MRIDPRLLSLVLVLGCGGADKSDQATMPTDNSAAAEPAATDPGMATETPPAEEAAPPAESKPAPTPDLVAAAADMAKVAFEDDKVRVVEVSLAKGTKLPMFQIGDHVVYAVSGGKASITQPEAEAKQHDMKTGDAMFMPAGMLSVENVGDTDMKVALVELKPGAQFDAAPKGTDPLKAGGKLYKKVFENDRVRVLTVTFKKGQSIKAHAHPYHVVYVLEAGKLKITAGKEEPQEMDLQVGQSVAIPAQVHSAKNTGTTQVKAVVFEFKGAAAPAAEPTK